MNERISILKNKIAKEKRFVSIEQAQIITRVFKNTEGEPRAIRRAKSFLASCNEIPIHIDPLELIVGNRTPGRRAGVVFPEAGIQWLDKEIENLPFREQDKFFVKEEDVPIFREEIIPYWRGQSLEDSIKSSPEGKEIKRTEKVLKINQKDHAQGHILPDVQSWLKLGPAGILKAFSQAKNKETDADKQLFYKSVYISVEGSIAFINRYRLLALELAEGTSSEQTKEHFLKISGICKNIANQPPENFHEAIQSIWFLFVLLQLESNASSFSPGRMDQYLYSYYKKDIEKGILTKDKALEIISCLWLKFNEIVYLRNAHSAKFFAGFPIGFNVAVGGVDENGNSAENELSYIMLEAQKELGLPQPNLSARIGNKTPVEFLDSCVEVIAEGSGMPQIFNDEAIIPALQNQGISQKHALDYGIVGCVELTTHGNNLGWSDAAMFNMVKVIELAMNNGICMLTGKQTGLQTGHLNDFKSYADFETALEKQMNYFIEIMMELTAFVEQVHIKMLPSPFLSSVINNCLSKGLDVTAGGALYNFSGIQFIQVANVADSLAVLKSGVFENKKLTPDNLMYLLTTNFKNNEIARQMLLTQIPKYGNDIAWVDELGLKWAKKFADKISSFTNPRGGRCHTGFYTVSAHVPMGSNVAATPDGRLANTPLADGGLSAVYGRDLNGPTALLHSVSRIDSMLGSNGTLLNMKFLPSFFTTKDDIRKFSFFLRGLIKLKISHVQFNVVNKEELVKAQKEPEKYRNLTIRVAGYTAYFTELAEDLQNEIIERTEHGA
ncbi:formate C-acetyltransferase/glycerol dehydratase family glycyl radical enzyme [Draconibacterium sp.]|nr:formate C-acetyltransferase/glycerol dehydratase family glycyl radical enzyme [Draconibacterium sp.]